ncbi:MAG: hypothetical protein KF803_06920 [Cyclobacteriaceae bacterium]|nr:hypothetical protein [Cyclobacteriaceae bacterium]
MIYFLTTRRNSKQIRNFLRAGGAHFENRLTVIFYENLERLRSLKAGSFIFSDFDLLTPAQREVVKRIFDQLKNRYPELKLYNNPNHVLLRYDLLKRMRALGINKFDVVRATETFGHLRFPLFIREADRHTGPLTPLLHAEEEVNHHLRLLKALGYSLYDLLIIEYVDASSTDGMFIKMSGFVLGDSVMPRYLNYSPTWMVKSTVYPNDELMKQRQQEVEAYMRTNPHRQWLQQVFKEANITYGRADYALVNGELQLWEINLNPAFVRPPRDPDKDPSEQRFMRHEFYKQFFVALEEADHKGEGQLELTITRADASEMRPPLWFRIKRGFHARLHKKKPRYMLMRTVSYALVRFWLSFFANAKF